MWLLLMFSAATLVPARALARQAPAPLSDDQQLAIARAFAPTLVFHPDERYFPTSSIDDNGATGWSRRVDAYLALSKPDKLARATLAYRVFPRVEGIDTDIIVEYWCYYVFNAYTIKGAWLPYRMPDNHPHDLERIYLVLRPTAAAWRADARPDDDWARAAFQVTRVVANAHDGSVPPNQYAPRAGGAVAPPVTILVERGAHAMAPDINLDGRFTPGVDSTARAKVVWGIRDHGSTWRGYRASFMDPRGANAVRLCGPAQAEGAGDPPCTPYSLYPADDLQRWFQELDVTGRDREAVVGSTPWLVRTFGDMRVEELLAPSDAADGRAYDRLLRRRSTTEKGFVVGFTTVDHTPTLVLGRRHFWEVPNRRAPDVLAEVDVLLPANRLTLFEGTVWGTYKVDAISSVMIGFGYFSENQSASAILGAEVRLGRFRVRPSVRLNDGGFDTRISTTF
jgi:hypothetical protein